MFADKLAALGRETDAYQERCSMYAKRSCPT